MDNFIEVINYPKWTNVLEKLGLQTFQKINLIDLQKVVPRRTSHEGLQHKRLKEHVAQNPQCVGVEESLSPGKLECKLKSGDIPDVLFKNKKYCIAVEVISCISDEKDLERGLFQCVKYRAILEACRNLDNKEYYVDARLAIEETLPEDLKYMKKLLDIKVYENIQVSNL